ncbi:MAG: xanthine dehydrogenase accessory protein XdhC [Deltaproteobacteria bacterium]|nr:xanthine dehydrogenase accessory protein XdhC [Deltaproteobacteria bacterium]MBI3294999.1 xanthine dehydrogenase accessory protein XdhC [Deltaproteobacteria bacterium]
MDWDWISAASEFKNLGRAFSVVTVCEVRGSGPRELGAKMIVLTDGTIRGTIGGGNLEHQAIQKAVELLKMGLSERIRYPLGAKVGQCCGGSVDLLFESISTSPSLYIFGAGHVGQAVCEVMHGTGFQLHLIDEREEFVSTPGLPSTVTVHSCEWDSFVSEAEWDARLTYAVVMTHRHDLDEAIVGDLMRRPARYIGLIGSQAKWTRFQQRYESRGTTPAEMARVKCPIGLENYGKSPKAVAISLAAELLCISQGRETGTE